MEIKGRVAGYDNKEGGMTYRILSSWSALHQVLHGILRHRQETSEHFALDWENIHSCPCDLGSFWVFTGTLATYGHISARWDRLRMRGNKLCRDVYFYHFCRSGVPELKLEKKNLLIEFLKHFSWSRMHYFFYHYLILSSRNFWNLTLQVQFKEPSAWNLSIPFLCQKGEGEGPLFL